MERGRRRKRFSGFRIPPLKVGDEIHLSIEAVGSKGDGIGKYKGFVVFVPGTKEGEEVDVKITKVFPKFAIGEIIKG